MKKFIKSNNEYITMKWKVQDDISLFYDGERHEMQTYTWDYDKRNTFKIVPAYYRDKDELLYDVYFNGRYLESFYSSGDAMEFVGQEYDEYII